MSLVGSYTFNYDQISLDEATYFLDLDGDGVATCEPLRAGRYLCDAIGNRTSSILGATLSYDATDSRFRPTRGRSASVGLEYAGLGGSVNYVRARAKAAQYFNVFNGFILSFTGEGGYIKGLKDRGGNGIDDVLLTDRFFLGEPQIHGFDIRGVGPRVIRRQYDAATGEVLTDPTTYLSDDAIGGNAYYLGRAELEIPLGSGVRELGLRPSIYMDVGALFNVTSPQLIQSPFPDGIQIQSRNDNGELLYILPDASGTTTAANDGMGTDYSPAIAFSAPPFQEVFLGNSASPRVVVGIGVNWNSPFGPFRIDFAHALKTVEGDDTKKFSFNVGTQF